MDIVARGIAIYLVLLVLFRLMGKRALNKATTFDFVLLLIISETTQQALVGDDFSLTTCFVLVTTLLATDLVFSWFKGWSRGAAKVLDDIPLVVVENGVVRRDRMAKARIDDEDILSAARELAGLERMSQVRYAVLEQDGKISIIPYR